MRDLCADCILKPMTQYRTYSRSEFKTEYLTVQKFICGLKILILSWSGLQIQTNRTLPNIPKVGKCEWGLPMDFCPYIRDYVMTKSNLAVPIRCGMPWRVATSTRPYVS